MPSSLLKFRRFLHSFSLISYPSKMNKFNTQVKTIDPSTISFTTEEIEDPLPVITDPNTSTILNEAMKLLKDDNVIAMPTETVYGLASNALSQNAIKKIYLVKNRPADNPLIVHISSLKMLRTLLPSNKKKKQDDLDYIGEIP